MQNGLSMSFIPEISVASGQRASTFRPQIAEIATYVFCEPTGSTTMYSLIMVEVTMLILLIFNEMFIRTNIFLLGTQERKIDLNFRIIPYLQKFTFLAENFLLLSVKKLLKTTFFLNNYRTFFSFEDTKNRVITNIYF